MKKLPIIFVFALFYFILGSAKGKDLLLQTSRWPNDVLIATDRLDEKSLSMDVDLNDDIYLACTRYEMARGDEVIDIYKSWDDGETWAVFKSFMFNNGAFIQPLSLCVTQNNIVVLFSDDDIDDYLWAYWVRKDLSDSNLVCVYYDDWSELVSVDNIDYNDDDLFALFRGKHSNGNHYLMFCFSHDEGQTWSTADTIVDAQDLYPTTDGAVTTGMQGVAQKIFATAYLSYTNPIEIYVWRSYSSGWDLVYQKNAGSGEHIRNPVIKALQNGSECTVLLYYEKENASGDHDLSYAYSENSGDPGTWNEGTISIPGYDQLSPQIGVGGYGHDYFYVSYWDWYPDGIERVRTIMHHKNDMGNPIIREASHNAHRRYDFYETDVTWTLQSTTPIVAWFDGRNGLLDIYCNIADTTIGISEEKGLKENDALTIQNKPNPVCSFTQIKYTIPVYCYVKLKVYNQVGREVATLIEKKMPTGNYKCTWDIRNTSKKKLPNGVYFYRLKAGNFAETKKMVVVR